MKKTAFNRVPLALVFLFAAALVTAQTSRLETFRENFATANLQTRLEILRAAEGDDPAEFGPLYRQAINYVLNNADALSTEPMLREIALLAANRIEEGRVEPASADLWRLFQVYEETSYRIRVLRVIGTITTAEGPVVEGIIDWVRRRHVIARGGDRPDLQVLAAALETLGRIGDPRSFTVLLDALLLQYPDFVTGTARESLAQLDGDTLALSFAAIKDRPLDGRRSVFSLVLEQVELDETERMELARRVLSDTLAAGTGDIRVQEDLRQVRYTAARILRDGSYEPATRELVLHFNQTILEFERRRISSGPLLEAIATLGATGSEDAAQRLTEYLELVNTYTESDRPYETQIVLAVIGNLEELGYPLSYNALFYTTLLENYPSRVRERARQAMLSVTQ